MTLARLGVLLALAWCSSFQDAESSALERERQLVEGARAALHESNYALARERAAAAVSALLARPSAAQGDEWLRILEAAGDAAFDAQDADTSKTARDRILEIRSRSLPAENADVLLAKRKAAATAFRLRDLRRAQALEEDVLAVCERTLPEDHEDVQTARLNLAATLHELGDLRGSLEQFESCLRAFERTLPDEHPHLQIARNNVAATRRELGDLAGARALFERVLEVRTRTLPDGHLDVQATRLNLAATLGDLGDPQAARKLLETVREHYARTLPPEHPDRLLADINLASTIKGLGDLRGARTIEESVLAVRMRTLPDDHPDLQAARNNLAVTLAQLGDQEGARALKEKVLEMRTATLPPDHPDVQAARMNLATTLKDLGDLRGALALQRDVLEVLSRTMPDEARIVQNARENLAATMRRLGDAAGAREILESVLEIDLRTLPSDHLDVQSARVNLAGACGDLGDFYAARAHGQAALEIMASRLPDDHPTLQIARLRVAETIQRLGDLAGARALQEQALDHLARALPDEHPRIQAARQGLAGTLYLLGDMDGARALLERALAVYERTLPDDHPSLQDTREDLAAVLHSLGRTSDARDMLDEVVRVRSRTMPEHHPRLLRSRANLAVVLTSLGELDAARTLASDVVEVYSRTLSDERTEWSVARENLAWTLAHRARRFGDATAGRSEPEPREWCARLVGGACAARTAAARRALLTLSPREAQAQCERLAEGLDTALSFANGLDLFDPVRELDVLAFTLSEATRGAALASAAMMRAAAGAPPYAALRNRLRLESEALAELAVRDPSSEQFHAARVRREGTESELVALARELSGGRVPALEPDIAALSRALPPRSAAVAYRRYTDTTVEEPAPDGSGAVVPRDHEVARLCAFIVRSADTAASAANPSDVFARVELGAMEPVERAVSRWRAAVGAGTRTRGAAAGEPTSSPDRVDDVGEELRRLIFDPLLPALRDVDHVIAAPDDVLHLVPLDALPASAPASAEDREPLLGDRLRIETRATVAELLAAVRPGASGGALVVVGGVAYGPTPGSEALGASESSEARAPGDEQTPANERDSTRSGGFDELPGSAAEARAIADSFADHGGANAAVTILDRELATREKLIELAPRARWLHVATHGWFASESIPSWNDARSRDGRAGSSMRMSRAETMKGMSPMLLCGLALAGANSTDEEDGRARGLVTAEEIAALDLSQCELAVLSACDTNVGERRAGQGVASFQQALQMAGARSAITSQWKVPDDATRELMTDFYRRIWLAKTPKWRALWEAKRTLRDAKDERGHPKYTTRDWAAWILTGEPD